MEPDDNLDVTPQACLENALLMCKEEEPDKAIVILLYEEDGRVYKPRILSAGLSMPDAVALLEIAKQGVLNQHL